jgi:hypothetical protein
VMEGLPHMAFIEAPKEVAAVLASFLDV